MIYSNEDLLRAVEAAFQKGWKMCHARGMNEAYLDSDTKEFVAKVKEHIEVKPKQ